MIDLLNEWDWEVLQDPQYSADLSLCDFFLFPQMKKSLRGRQFSTAKDIIAACNESVKDMDRHGVHHGINGLLHPRQKCKKFEGDYVK